jgi:hypothetical protein
MKKNLRFNRVETKSNRFYLNEFTASRELGCIRYKGYVKCKLVHHQTFSTIVPDQIYFESAGRLLWIQPLYFLPSTVFFDETSGFCRLNIDVSHGLRIVVQFKNNDVCYRLRDGSLVYRCELISTPMLASHATGLARLSPNGPRIKLFHHTTHSAKRSILKSSEFWSSTWNMQGVKRLENISFLYLTPLNDVAYESDLREIAMSSEGCLRLRLDDNYTNIPDVQLTVYRESATNRTQSIESWIDADLLSPQHVYWHKPSNEPAYYQVVCPFVHRIGVKSSTNVKIQNSGLTPVAPKFINFLVVGDATTIQGLNAPYDEESTPDVWRIDRMKDDEEFIAYWRDHGNTQIFDSIEIEPFISI